MQRLTYVVFINLAHYYEKRRTSRARGNSRNLVPRLSGTRNVHAWTAWYIFSRDHDVIKIGPKFLERKGNALRVIQLALRSTLGVYDIRTPIAM